MGVLSKIQLIFGCRIGHGAEMKHEAAPVVFQEKYNFADQEHLEAEPVRTVVS